VFYYALSEVLFQFLKNNGQLPLLAAHDHFVVRRGREEEPFDIAFELELIPSHGELGEHDIVATWGSELWLGEATADDKLGTARSEMRRLRRLKLVAELLSARGILFVTESERFSDRTKRNVEAVFSDRTWPEVAYEEWFSTRPRGSNEE
jgi:hypothetical protein